MSSNNRQEASKGGWCLESLFFLIQPWLPARKHVPSSLLCAKRASQARILLPVRLHLNQPFIGSSRTSRSCSIVVKKASGLPRKSSKHQDRLLKLIQLRDQGTTSTELAREWQQAGVSASARTVRRRLLEDGLVSRRASKKPLLSRKNIRDRLIFCKRYRDWTAENWGKVIFSDESPFRLFGASGKKLVRRRQGERYHQSCVMPTVKHPETIHVCGCFSAKGVGSLTIFPKNTAMNRERYQHILREQLLPTIQEQFSDEQCLFQHDGAPCHKAKVITKLGPWPTILGPWPGNSPD
uniref:Transposase Tc1-like domain-containing protein n=1 Tax=Salmo trutta TaxID=8032 RepID=A0A674DNM5_SALTR